VLHSDYLSVLEAQTRDGFQIGLVRFTKQLGFNTVSATAIIDHFQTNSEFITVANTPAGFVDAFNDPVQGKRDPVTQHCKVKSVPIIWDQTTYVAVGQGERWEQQASFRYRHGICLALHSPGSRHFLFGVDRDQPLPHDPVEVMRLVATVQLFAVHAQEAADHVLLCMPKMRPIAFWSQKLQMPHFLP